MVTGKRRIRVVSNDILHICRRLVRYVLDLRTVSCFEVVLDASPDLKYSRVCGVLCNEGRVGEVLKRLGVVSVVISIGEKGGQAYCERHAAVRGQKPLFALKDRSRTDAIFG